MKRAVLLFIALVSPALPLRAETLRGIIHIHSDYSGKKLSLEQLLLRCRERGANVVFFTDDVLRRWEYGFFPLRRLAGHRREEASVLKRGARRYLAEIATLRKKYPDMVLIPGAEAAPFYYWSGNLFRDRQLVLNDWHRHFLIVGLEKPEDYETLPLASNPGAGNYGFASLLLLWPALLFLPVPSLWRRGRRVLAALLCFTAGAALYNNYPFRRPEFDPYHGDRGSAPYQRLIDDVTAKGGLIFWAHPDSPDFKDGLVQGHVLVRTRPYGDRLLSTDGYTGFAGFYEGYRQTAVPGGYWDRALVEYCAGKRKTAPAVIGEADFIDEPDIDEVQLVFEAKERSVHGVMEALARGAFHVLYRPVDHSLILSRWEVRPLKGQPFIRFKVDSDDGKARALAIRLIRDGKLHRTFEGTTPLEASYADPLLTAGTHYYRLDIYERYGSQILTNPLFFKNNLIQ